MFNHNLTKDSSTDTINGYSLALAHVLKYLQATTQFKPENRYIDCVPLLDGISKTSEELTTILKEKQTELTAQLQTT